MRTMQSTYLILLCSLAMIATTLPASSQEDPFEPGAPEPTTNVPSERPIISPDLASGDEPRVSPPRGSVIGQSGTVTGASGSMTGAGAAPPQRDYDPQDFREEVQAFQERERVAAPVSPESLVSPPLRAEVAARQRAGSGLDRQVVGPGVVAVPGGGAIVTDTERDGGRLDILPEGNVATGDVNLETGDGRFDVQPEGVTAGTVVGQERLDLLPEEEVRRYDLSRGPADTPVLDQPITRRFRSDIADSDRHDMTDDFYRVRPDVPRIPRAPAGSFSVPEAAVPVAPMPERAGVFGRHAGAGAVQPMRRDWRLENFGASNPSANRAQAGGATAGQSTAPTTVR